jgi:DNA-binding transcriptional MocR family regulator
LTRNTAHLAFEQLIAEGYVEGRVGAGQSKKRPQQATTWATLRLLS